MACSSPDVCCGLLFPQSSQSLWNRLSVLLNLLPSAADLQDSGMGKGAQRSAPSLLSLWVVVRSACSPLLTSTAGRDLSHGLFSAQTPLGLHAIP